MPKARKTAPPPNWTDTLSAEQIGEIEHARQHIAEGATHRRVMLIALLADLLDYYSKTEAVAVDEPIIQEEVE